jgi:hypothetical protein
MLLCCLVVRLDPLGWRSTLERPKPLKPLPPGRVAEVDLIEVSHQPGARFSQLIFWSKYPDDRLHVREWRLLKNPAMLPKREHDRWLCLWTEGGIVKCVQAPEFRESSGSTDPEIADRNFIAKQDRCLLWEVPWTRR